LPWSPLKRFDPNRGVRFATYATCWIRAEIPAYVVRSRSLVRMGTTATQKKLFFNLGRFKAQVGSVDAGDLSEDDVARIATELRVPRGEVVQMNRRLFAADASLQAPVREDGADWKETHRRRP
jgi:RNA polymerase sigma-32 factor